MFRSLRIIPESLPWLIAKNRMAEAKRVLQTAARWNKVTLPEKYRANSDDDIASVYTTGSLSKDALKMRRPLVARADTTANETKQYTVLDIVGSPKLRVYAVVMFYLWYVSD